MTFYLAGSSSTVAGNGMNLWFNQPSAVFYSGHNDRTYYAYTNSLTQVAVRSYDHQTNSYSAEFVISDLTLRPDDHYSPAIEVIQHGPNQGRILIAFSYHATPMTVMMSAAPEDLSAFVQVAQLPDRTTYPSFVQSGDGFRIFYRETTGLPGQLNAAYASILSDESATQWSAPTLAFDPGPGWSVYGFPPVERDGEIFLAFYYYPSVGGANQHSFGYAVSADGGATWSSRNGAVAKLGLDDVLAFPSPPSSRIIDAARVDGEWLVSMTTYVSEGAVGAPAIGRIVRVSDGAVLQEKPVAVNYYADGLVFDDVNPHYVYYATATGDPAGGGRLMMSGFSPGMADERFTLPFVWDQDLTAARPGSIRHASTPGSLTWIDVDNYARWFSFSTALHSSPEGLRLIDRSSDGVVLSGNMAALFPAVPGDPSPAVLIATRFNDRIVGTIRPDVVAGLEGGDAISTGAGADWLSGGAGDDVLTGGPGGDVLNGDGGTKDEARYTIAQSSVTVDLSDPSGASNAGDALGDTFSGIERFRLSAHSDTFKGSSVSGSVNWASGEAGSDTFFSGGLGTANQFWGGAGDDTVFGGGGSDFARGGAGNDRLIGEGERDQLSGEAGADWIEGGADADVLDGGADDDTLNGGTGNDVLVGGLGTDRFVFGSAVEGRDLVRDFDPVTDKIVVLGAGFGVSSIVLQAGAGPAASGAGGQFLYDTNNGRLSFDADGAGGAAAVWIATLTGKPAIALGSFELI